MTNAEGRLSNSLRPRKPEGSLGRTAQDVHLDSHTAPELCVEKDPKETQHKAFVFNKTTGAEMELTLVVQDRLIAMV